MSAADALDLDPHRTSSGRERLRVLLLGKTPLSALNTPCEQPTQQLTETTALLGSRPHPSSSENAEADTKKVVVERNGNANGNAHANSSITCIPTGHVRSFDVGAYVAFWKGHCASASRKIQAVAQLVVLL